MTKTEALLHRGPDILSPSNRKFYESTKMKMTLTMLYVASSFFFMALCASEGGQSASAKFTAASVGDDNIKHANITLASGLGFSGFCNFVSFMLCVAAAVVINPLHIFG